jgi:hypothetical protein
MILARSRISDAWARGFEGYVMEQLCVQHKRFPSVLSSLRQALMHCHPQALAKRRPPPVQAREMKDIGVSWCDIQIAENKRWLLLRNLPG